VRWRTQALRADVHRFGPHAALPCAAEERQRLEWLCHCITRPALANGLAQCNNAGQEVRRLLTLWRDGTTRIVMSPLKSMHRLPKDTVERPAPCARRPALPRRQTKATKVPKRGARAHRPPRASSLLSPPRSVETLDGMRRVW